VGRPTRAAIEIECDPAMQHCRFEESRQTLNVVRAPSLIAGVGRMHCALLWGCCGGLPGVWEMETVLELTSRVVKVFLRGSRVAGPVPGLGPGLIDNNRSAGQGSRIGQCVNETQAT